MTEATRRKIIREWLRQKMEGKESVNLPDLTKEAVAAFTADKDFMRSLAEDILRPVVYAMGAQLLARTRNEEVYNFGPDEIVAKSEFEKRAAALSKRWARWMEYTGTDYRQFMRCGKEDLQEAAQRREKRAATEYAIARFERHLAGKMKKGEVVEDRWTADDLEEIWMRINGTTEEGDAA